MPWAIQVDLPDAQFAQYGHAHAIEHPIQWRGDGRNLPFKDETLDWVYNSHIAEDFSDWPVLLEEFLRVLKRDGTLITMVPDRERFRESVKSGQGDNFAHKHEFQVGELTEWATKRGGLKVVKDELTLVRGPGDYNILFIAKKDTGSIQVPPELGVWFHNYTLPDGTRTIPLDKPAPAWGYDNPKLMVDEIAKLLPKNGAGRQMLDIACNAGYAGNFFAQRGYIVEGFDNNPIHIAQAAWASKQLGLKQDVAFWRECDFKDFYPVEGDMLYDVVLMLGFLYHTEDPVVALKRAASWTTKYLVIETDTSELNGSVIEFDNENQNGYRNTSLPTVDAIHKMADRAGMKVEKLFHWCGRRVIALLTK